MGDKDDFKADLLLHASESGNRTLVQLLLETWPESTTGLAKRTGIETFWRALGVAAWAGHSVIVEMMLTHLLPVPSPSGAIEKVIEKFKLNTDDSMQYME